MKCAVSRRLPAASSTTQGPSRSATKRSTRETNWSVSSASSHRPRVVTSPRPAKCQGNSRRCSSRLASPPMCGPIPGADPQGREAPPRPPRAPPSAPVRSTASPCDSSNTLSGDQGGASLDSSGSMNSSAHQERRSRERGEGRGSVGASCKYESNTSGFTADTLYNALSQLSSSPFPPFPSPCPVSASPTSHTSRYIGCASEIPNRESFLAGYVKSGSAVSAGARDRKSVV